jgi:hypothetical protein
VQECNWLQSFENAVDPVHAAWLHYTHSGPQFYGTGEPGGIPLSHFDPYTIAGKLAFEKTEHGVMYTQRVDPDNLYGNTPPVAGCVEVQLPNIIALPDFVIEEALNARHDCLIWIVPADDMSFRAFSQGPITQHSDQTLATSDKGIVMLRRQLRQMVDDVEAGRDPQNTEHGEARPRDVRSGVFTLPAEPHPAAAAPAAGS